MGGIITKDLVINDCIKKYPDTIGVFNKYNIDSCCGGAATLEEACKRDKANLNDVLNDLNKKVGGGK